MATTSDYRKNRQEEIKAQREKAKEERETKNKAREDAKKLREEAAQNNTEESPKGLSALSPIILNQAIVLADTLLPYVINIATTKLGIDPNASLDSIPCPTDPEALLLLEDVINELNNLIDSVNGVGNVIDSFRGILNVVNPIVNTVQTGVGIATVAQLAISQALKALPPGALAAVPGFVVALPDDIDYIKSLILFNNDGTPRLPEIKAGISAISGAITLTQLPLSEITNVIEKIKGYFTKCLPSNAPASFKINDFSPSVINSLSNIQQTNNNINNSYYNGFLIEIEEKDFSPTVKQKRAVGKNKDGIILIQTPYSFTTANQTLINELKLIIDRDNLKAY